MMFAVKTIAFICILFFQLSFTVTAQSFEGMWETRTNNGTAVLLITPGYFSYTAFNEKEKLFILTYGGKWKIGDAGAEITIEFHTKEKTMVGKQMAANATMESGKLVTMSAEGGRQEWTQVDNGKGPLAGDWRISGRGQKGVMTPIIPGARKTVKILSGKGFQWIAMNTDTGEFFGTGGGTYTFKDGTYTEHIAFFSRDSSRVGAVLSFKGKVEGNNWDHSGLSSKGDPIHEIWTRQ